MGERAIFTLTRWQDWTMSDQGSTTRSASNADRWSNFSRRHWERIRHHPDAPVALVGVVISLAVCFPFFGPGRLFLLDWSIGPHAAILSSAFYGLNGGLTAGVMDSIVMGALNYVLGGPATWLPIVAFFPLAAIGAGRLAGGSRWSRIGAGTLYAVNPFVFNRLFVGHIPLLIGYALLPYATSGALRSMVPRSARWFVAALWWALLTALSPHFAWIYGVVVVGVALVSLRQHSWRRALGWLVTSGAAFVLTSAYLIAPHLVTTLPTQVGQASLDLYRTTSDPHLGLYLNVLGLYGFWRIGPGPVLPKDIITGWPFILLAVLLVVGLGAWSRLRRQIPNAALTPRENVDPQVATELNKDEGEAVTPVRSHQRTLAALLAVVGVAGYFLALGNQGPTGPLFGWAYVHVPFFAIMREPQKFLMLLALAYAVFFGWGVDRFAQLVASPASRRRMAAAALTAIALPMAYTPTIFGGLAGQLANSTLPRAYQQADSLMGDGTGNVLYLPWHLYLAYPFAQDRVIANSGPASFQLNVIAGDNVESGNSFTQSTSPRSAYLEELFFHSSEIHHFGSLVSPLGVKYVVLSKTVDWSSYQWLSKQRDLQLVLNSPSLEVWRNRAYFGDGAVTPTITGARSIDQLISLSNSNHLNFGVVASPEVARSADSLAPSQHGSNVSAFRTVQRLSPVTFRIPAGSSGWANLDVPYEPGWHLGSNPAIASIEGTVLVRISRQGRLTTFSPWTITRVGYLVTIIVSAAIFAPVFRLRRRSRG